jgi:hypothetical protein
MCVCVCVCVFVGQKTVITMEDKKEDAALKKKN